MQPQNPYTGGPGYPGAPQNPYGAQPALPPKRHFNMLIVPLVLSVLLLFAAVAFGAWAYQERNTYKFDTDEVVRREVEIAVRSAETKKDNEFLEREKQPLRTYKGPAAYGTVSFSYPKTWSAQVSETSTSKIPLTGYLNPDFVPALDDKSSFAARFEVVESPYSAELKRFDSDIKQGKVTAAPYVAPKVEGVTGSRLKGEIISKKQGVMILLPLRDKTLRIWTESNDYIQDLDTHILSSLTFVP